MITGQSLNDSSNDPLKAIWKEVTGNHALAYAKLVMPDMLIMLHKLIGLFGWLKRAWQRLGE